MGFAGKTSYRKDGQNDKDKIREAVSQLKHEDEAYHERIIEMLTHKCDDYSSFCEGDVTDSTDSDEITFNKLLLTKVIRIKSLQQGNIQSNILQL